MLLSRNKNRSLIDSVSKARNKSHQHFIPEVEDILEKFRTDLRGAQHNIHNSGINHDMGFVVFLGLLSQRYLKKSKVWLIGGTFRTVPHHFTQLVPIHGILCGKSFPLCCVLLKTKREVAYKTFSFSSKKGLIILLNI